MDALRAGRPVIGIAKVDPAARELGTVEAALVAEDPGGAEADHAAGELGADEVDPGAGELGAAHAGRLPYRPRANMPLPVLGSGT